MVTSRSAVVSLPAVFITVISLGLTAFMHAQETSTTTTHKSVAHTRKIDSAQVVYTSGDDAVLKLPDGNLRLFELAPGTPLIIDGKRSTPADLTPGMTISHVQLTSRTESDVTSVTEINGKVTAKNGTSMTLQQDDGTSTIYRVPHSASFTVDGKTVDYADVTKGMNVAVTAVKTEPVSTVSNKAAMVAQTPSQSGTLVIVRR